MTVILHSPQIRASVGQIEAAGVPQRVRVDILKAGGICGSPHDVVDSLAGQLRPRSDTNSQGRLSSRVGEGNFKWLTAVERAVELLALAPC